MHCFGDCITRLCSVDFASVIHASLGTRSRDDMAHLFIHIFSARRRIASVRLYRPRGEVDRSRASCNLSREQWPCQVGPWHSGIRNEYSDVSGCQSH